MTGIEHNCVYLPKALDRDPAVLFFHLPNALVIPVMIVSPKDIFSKPEHPKDFKRFQARVKSRQESSMQASKSSDC